MNGNHNGNIETEYKLIYFDVRGRGEIPRLLFHAADVPFEDYRINSGEDWFKSLKHKYPQKVLPVLEVDGKQLSQSLTIGRYLAREFGLTGKTHWDQSLVEQVADTMDDLRAEVAKWIYAPTEEEKEEISKTLKKDTYPKFIGILEATMKQNDSKSGYMVGENLSLADISVFETWTFPLSIHPEILDDHPEILAHRSRVENHDNLRDYIKNRPTRIV